jgi:hypothetical protein
MIDGLCTILTLVCSLSLVLLGAENLKSLPVPGSVVTVIAVSTMVIACVQFLRHASKTRPTKVVDEVDLADFHSTVNEVSAEVERRGSQVIMAAMSNRFTSRKTSLPEIEKLHRYIDICASAYHVSGSRVLFLALAQRIEYLIAGLALHITPWIIRIGYVRLDFLPAGTTPFAYYRSIWLEDMNMMLTARMRSRFVLMRFVDAVGIVCDYGILARVHAIYLALARALGLKKLDRF